MVVLWGHEHVKGHFGLLDFHCRSFKGYFRSSACHGSFGHHMVPQLSHLSVIWGHLEVVKCSEISFKWPKWYSKVIWGHPKVICGLLYITGNFRSFRFHLGHLEGIWGQLNAIGGHVTVILSHLHVTDKVKVKLTITFCLGFTEVKLKVIWRSCNSNTVTSRRLEIICLICADSAERWKEKFHWKSKQLKVMSLILWILITSKLSTTYHHASCAIMSFIMICYTRAQWYIDLITRFMI